MLLLSRRMHEHSDCDKLQVETQCLGSVGSDRYGGGGVLEYARRARKNYDVMENIDCEEVPSSPERLR